MSEQGVGKKESSIRVDIIQAVKTPLGFFALIVLVVEAILGITAGISEGTDRTYLIIGMISLIFILIIIVASLAIFRPEALSGTRPQPVAPSSLGKELAVSPTISTEQTHHASEKFISGEQGNFIVLDPRPYWNISWKSLGEILKEESGIADRDFYSNIQNALIGDYSLKNILQIKANTSYEIIPIPGVSRKNGLPYLFIQHAKAIPEIVIFSKNKFVSQFADKESILHYAMDRFTGLIAVGFIPTSIVNIQRKDNRPAIVFEAETRLEDFVINGTQNQEFVIKATVVCLESQSRLYSIILQYVESEIVPQADIDRLHEIVNSFRVAEEFDDNKAIQEAVAEGRELQKQFFEGTATGVFSQNVYFLLNRLAEVDFSKEESVTFAITETEKVIKIAEILKLNIAEYENLKQSFEKARQGDSQEFIEQIQSAIETHIKKN